MTKIDTKEMKERYLLRDPNKILSIGESLEVAHLCDAYDEAQKEIARLKLIINRFEESYEEHAIKCSSRISTLEALLREILGDCHSTFCDGDNHHYCDACDECHDNVEMIPHRESCVFKRIQKELGEG